jgi:hypothetical protein
MTESITPFNYCTHAIDDLKRTAKEARSRGVEITASRIETLIEMLSVAPKFLLPNCAELIDTDNVRDTHLDLLRLPYPVTVFEAPWQKDEAFPLATVAGVRESLSTRRIALCWEMNASKFPFSSIRELPILRQHYPEGGIFVYPIYYSDEHKSWNPGTGGTFVPREFRIPENHPPTRMTEMLLEVKERAGRLNRNAFRHFAEPFVLMDEIFQFTVAQSHGDTDAALARVSYDANDEVQMTIQACAVLNCANVQTIDVRPKPAMNARRSALGRAPFYSYKVLQLNPGKATANAADIGSTHASPRTHLRRGHIRRLESKVTWVRPSVVNLGSEQGTVAKDYRLGD